MKSAKPPPIPLFRSFSGVWFALVVAAAVRGAVLWFRRENLNADPDAYRQLAETLARDGVLGFGSPLTAAIPTAFRPPGYPYLLSWLVRDGSLPNFSVALLHWLFGLGTVILVYRLAQRLAAGLGISVQSIPVIAVVASLLVAFDPILLVQSAQVMTETLATFLAVLALGLTARFLDDAEQGRGAVSGISLGACLLLGFLVRPISIVWAFLLAATGAIHLRRRSAIWGLVMASGLFAAGLGGWIARNLRAVSAPVWATSHGGYTLLLANNPLLYQHLRENPTGTYWDASRFLQAWDARQAGEMTEASFWFAPPEPQPLAFSEIEENRRASAAAWATIRREPTMFLWSCVIRVWWLWSPVPQTGSLLERIAVGSWYAMVYLAIAGSLYRFGKRLFSSRWIAGWLLVFALTGTHAVYWSNLRMRAPAMPFLVVVAACYLGLRNDASEAPVPEGGD